MSIFRDFGFFPPRVWWGGMDPWGRGSNEHTIRSHARKYALPKGSFDTAVDDIIL